MMRHRIASHPVCCCERSVPRALLPANLVMHLGNLDDIEAMVAFLADRGFSLWDTLGSPLTEAIQCGQDVDVKEVVRCLPPRS